MRWRSWAIPAVTLAGWGCGPPDIVPVVPPGMEYREVVPEQIPEDEVAQALGESRRNPAQMATPTRESTPPAEPTEVGKPKTTPSGLTYETLKAGSGAVAKPGQQVVVHYTGTLENGTVFDSSRDRGEPFSFELGSGQVIPGWDQGVNGMRVGERRKLIVPAELAYGAMSPDPKIPPNSKLIFDVELLSAE